MAAHTRQAKVNPIKFRMSPITAIGFSAQFFLVMPMIDRMIPARPVIMLITLIYKIQDKYRVGIPNINPAIAAALDLLTGAGMAVAGCRITG